MLSDFVREADKLVRVSADFLAIVFDLLFHEFNRTLCLLLQIVIIVVLELFELLDIVMDLYHLFDELGPPPVHFSLHHILGVVYQELDDLAYLPVHLGLLGLLRDFLDKFNKVVIPILDLLEHLVVNEELHVVLELADGLVVFEFELESGTLGLRRPYDVLRLLLAVLALLVQPQHHLAEFERVQWYVHF